MQESIILKNIYKSFNSKKVLDNVTITIPNGKIVGFIGPNGSGKSTIINIICGMIPADSGEGYCMGYNISTEQSYIKKNVGYMTQYFTLWDSLTVFENLVFIGKIRKVQDVKLEAEKIIVRLGLDRFRDTLSQHLSGGWKQKLSLACAIIHRPKILFLDEPTASIDPLARKEFWDLIFDLSAKGITILIVTHAIDEIEKCDSIVYLKSGALLFSGGLDELFSSQKLSTYLISGGNIENFRDKISLQKSIQIIPRGEYLSVTGNLDCEQLRREYPDLIFTQVPTPLDTLLYSLSYS